MIAAVDNIKKTDLLAQAQPADADFLPHVKALKGQFQSREALIEEVVSQRKKAKIFKSSVTGLCVAVFACTLWTINPILYTQNFSTAYAQQSVYQLPDESRLSLNSNSSVEAELRLFSRELKLIKGQASFSVAHGLRPFTVTARQATIKDIGTIFNVDILENTVLTTVQQGAVEVALNDRKLILHAGQSTQANGDLLSQPYTTDMETITAWQSGKIIFNGLPLNEAMAEIQRYRKAAITIDPRIASMRISGVYGINKIESFLNDLPSILPVKVDRHKDGEITISK